MKRPSRPQTADVGVCVHGQSIQEATASEPLSLQEERENQASWRAARDKLTFIVCAPLDDGAGEMSSARARGGDADERMRGDVNFFLYPAEQEDRGDGPRGEATGRWLVGEIDVMIAEREHRGRGLGREAVWAMLAYLCRHKDEMLAEYQQQHDDGARLKGVMAKIKQGNAGSRALFDGLGFRQQGGVNYFGEVTLVMAWAAVESMVRRRQGEEEWLRETLYD